MGWICQKIAVGGLVVVCGVAACTPRAAPPPAPRRSEMAAPAPTTAAVPTVANTGRNIAERPKNQRFSVGTDTVVGVSLTALSAEQTTLLRQAKARIDTLTSPAEAMVRRIEAAPPDRLTLLRLDAAFTDARRLMVTDARLAALGERLTAASRASVRRYSKARYDVLKARVAAAGVRHRAAP